MLCDYDRWKLSYPRWWDDEPEICEYCDQELEECDCEDEEGEECQAEK